MGVSIGRLREDNVFDGSNLYRYCMNNPVNFQDQNGRELQWVPAYTWQNNTELLDPETLETKGTITLKAGTSLRPISTNRKGWEEEAFEIFKVIDKDTSKEVYVKLDLSFAEDDSVAKINGENVMDLFVRVFMGA